MNTNRIKYMTPCAKWCTGILKAEYYVVGVSSISGPKGSTKLLEWIECVNVNGLVICTCGEMDCI